MKRISQEDLLALNPGLDLRKVEEFQAFCRAMEAAGIDIKPRYRISPALGGLPKGLGQKRTGDVRRQR